MPMTTDQLKRALIGAGKPGIVYAGALGNKQTKSHNDHHAKRNNWLWNNVDHYRVRLRI